MLAEVITGLFQDTIKRRFRWFGYWLYGSEIALGLFFAIVATTIEPVYSVPFFAYAGLTFYQMRKFASEGPPEPEPKVPVGRSCVAAIASVVILIVILLGAAFILELAGVA